MLSQDAEAEVLEPPQHQENQNEEVAEATTPRISSQVTIPNSNGKLIYKSTLIQLLNDDPKLSHDRLRRVRQRNEYNSKEIENISSRSNSSVCLFNDYAVLDRNVKSFFVGRVERMIFKKEGKKSGVQAARAVGF
ncbi:uncharacterized protein [Clytia hemisphaerica]|uniref:uncharacterized protein n=1 Tax=Clytia hemisphaerica TaxID=252671 RepID=UPI0034D50F34